VLRLWRAPVALVDGTPLWVGSVQMLHYTRPFGLFGLWQPRADDHAAWDELREAVQELDPIAEPHPQSGLPVLRIRTR